MRKFLSTSLVAGVSVTLLTSGCSGERSGSDEPLMGTAPAVAASTGTFVNPTELDMVQRLPRTQPDARILYGDSPLNYGDLRIPESADGDQHPLVILVHGGAWESSFTSQYFGELAEALTDAGLATWNLEFRRLNNPGGAFPGMFLDVANGVDYARQLAEQYPIDLDRVVLLGHSSGGHLAAWAAGRKNIPVGNELHSENPLPVKGFVDLAGVLDLEAAFAAGRKDVLQVVGAADGAQLSEKAPTTSPIDLLPLGVPQTLIVGTKDNPWRIEALGRYRDAAVAGGDDAELKLMEGANHFDVVDVCSPAWQPLITAVLQYVGKPTGGGATESPTVCQR